MREYEFVVTDESIEALRRLREPWTGYVILDDALLARLADGSVVRVWVEGAEVEPGLEALRLAARVDRRAAPDAVPARASDYAAGRNDVVVFRGESWLEPGPGGDGQGDAEAVQWSGRPGQHSATARAVVATTDAIVVATGAGTGMLVRTGAVAPRVEVVEDRVAVARFLASRGYRG